MIDIPDSIFPQDENGVRLCLKCRQAVAACVCPSGDLPKSERQQPAVSVRLDKKGRQGKVVTLIQGLRPDEASLKDLARDLKARTGSGGTHYRDGDSGVIEIQGDHRASISKVLVQQGFSVR